MIDGLSASFTQSVQELRALECLSWVREAGGAVTLTFPSIRAAERAFRKMLDDSALGISGAMPAEVAWINERMNR